MARHEAADVRVCECAFALALLDSRSLLLAGTDRLTLACAR
ncbi:hypothetical protein [Olsenella profusa]|nr:hypothetical protein [Olsenella profusa]